MDFVTPQLAIGALSEAADPRMLRQSGIDAVVSLLAVDFSAGEARLTLPIPDRVALTAESIRTVTAFIEHQRLAGRKTLLHCQMGISRSPALAACYLHEYADYSLADALEEVRRARPLADPHPALLASMATHYASVSAPPGRPEIDLSANENPLGPSPLAVEALHKSLSTAHRYPDRHGLALRRALAASHGGTPEQILLGNGSCEVIEIAARAFLAPGDTAIIAPPCFPAYRSAVRRAHGRLIEVPLGADDEFACRLEPIAAAIEARTRLIFLGNPNNPTGQGIDGQALDDWLKTLPPHVVVLLDEAYRDYVDEAATDTRPLLADGPSLVRAGHRLLVVRSFSKVHGLAGLRLGYAFGPREQIAALEAQCPTYNTNAAAQTAALAALGDHRHQRASRRLASAGLSQLASGLSALGLRCSPSVANFLLARFDHLGLDATHVAAELSAAGIAVKPGSVFGLPGHLRISVGRREENQRLLDQLGRITAAARQTKHDARQQER